MTQTPTEAPTSAEQPAEPATAMVQPEPGSRLRALLDEYPDARAAMDAASERLKQITDGIKLELTQANPEARRLEVRGEGLTPMSLNYVTAMRFDSKRLKADAERAAASGDQNLALLYASYAKQSGSWTLKALRVPEAGEQA